MKLGALPGLMLLTLATCTAPSSEMRTVVACEHGDAAACADRPHGDQIRLDVSAILLGARIQAMSAEGPIAK